MNIIYYISLLIILFLIIYITFIYYSIFNKNKYSKKNNTNKKYSCDKKSCGALDPVSDPKYNMQQIVKQSILLEEHLINKNKRCRDCITKHFQHIIGLSEEAQMLATDKIFQHLHKVNYLKETAKTTTSLHRFLGGSFLRSGSFLWFR